MSRHFVVILLLLVLSVVAGNNAGAAVENRQTDVNDFTISLLWPDGVLVPFAEYHGGKWLNPWPKPELSSDDEPNTVADLSKPWFAQNKKPSPTWYFWSSDGALHVLKAGKIVKVDSHCQTAWGLLSDLPKESTADSRRGKPGVALDAKRQVNSMTEVANTSDEWKGFLSFVRPAFEREEETRAAELSSFLTSPSGEDRKKVNVTLSHLYRSDAMIGERYLYYFEAQKEYREPLPANDQSCNNVIFRGWGIRNLRGDLSLLGTQIGWADCDLKGDGGRVPLGVLSIDDRAFVITYDPGYEGESYSILELTESGARLALETEGGSC